MNSFLKSPGPTTSAQEIMKIKFALCHLIGMLQFSSFQKFSSTISDAAHRMQPFLISTNDYTVYEIRENRKWQYISRPEPSLIE